MCEDGWTGDADRVGMLCYDAGDDVVVVVVLKMQQMGRWDVACVQALNRLEEMLTRQGELLDMSL